MADGASDLKPVPCAAVPRRASGGSQLSYQGQMSGQSVAEFLPVFLSHYCDDIRKSFRVKDIDNGHLNALATAVESHGESLDRRLQTALPMGGRLTG